MSRKSPLLTLLPIICMMNNAFGDERWQARSMVISRRGIVATSQTLASQAGAQMLARGGNAVDAAIAANAALGVVEPMMNGIGGDLFVIVRDGKTGKLSGLNASGWCPRGLTADLLKQAGHYGMPQEGIHSVTVPGAVEGWAQLHKRYGKLPWRELFRPAIYYARVGFPVTEWIQNAWDASRSKLQADDNARKIFLHNGQPPQVGDVFKNPQLGAALDLIAAGGSGRKSAGVPGPRTFGLLPSGRMEEGDDWVRAGRRDARNLYHAMGAGEERSSAGPDFDRCI